jgi:hypothetical protein
LKAKKVVQRSSKEGVTAGSLTCRVRSESLSQLTREVHT